MKLKRILKRILKWTSVAILLALFVGIFALFIAYWRSTNDCGRTAAPKNPMRAIVYCDYGLANLKLEEVEKPVPNDDQILVRVRAASVNPYDWHFIEGTPKIMRLMGGGLRKPKDTRLGVDYAGTVEAVGKNPAAAGQFKPGDEVFGGKTGALAEYVCVLADRSVVLKPANMTFEQAAAVPVAAITALQGLRDKGKIKPGQKVLINGASGGVGTFAVQIAKAFGAHVTAVCSTRNVEQARSLGADEVIDYTKEDFTRGGKRYDLILDVAASGPLSARLRALEPSGILVGVGSADTRYGVMSILGGLVEAAVLSRFGKQKMPFFLAKTSKEDLVILTELIEAGKVRP